jgi:hypothetical protein
MENPTDAKSKRSTVKTTATINGASPLQSASDAQPHLSRMQHRALFVNFTPNMIKT